MTYIPRLSYLICERFAIYVYFVPKVTELNFRISKSERRKAEWVIFRTDFPLFMTSIYLTKAGMNQPV
jgi:hypothetical protein